MNNVINMMIVASLLAVTVASQASAGNIHKPSRAPSCDDTRASRVNAVQGFARSYVAWLGRVAPHAKEIRNSCRISDKVTIGNSVLDVRHTDDVQCKSLPAGVTLSDAYSLLSIEPDRDWTAGRVDDDAHETAHDDMCRVSDDAAGVNPRVTYNDGAGIAKLLKWKDESTR